MYGCNAAVAIRDEIIIECSTHVLAFPYIYNYPDTLSIIKLAKEYKRKLIVVRV